MPDTPQLLARFATAFDRADRTLYDESDPLPPELDAGRGETPFARRRWRPARIPTPRAALESLYQSLPAPFPPLYEELILNYRWLRVDLLDTLTLLANPPAADFTPLLNEIRLDPVLTNTLFPAGLIPFARAVDIYDPLCFDTAHRRPDGDCPILRLEHESILCHDRIGAAIPIADSFQTLVNNIITLDNAPPRSPPTTR